MIRCRSRNPKLTRYKIVLGALDRAERRRDAAEKSIKLLKAKVKYYERTIDPETRAQLAAAARWSAQRVAERRTAWKEAEKTLEAISVAAGRNGNVEPLWAGGKPGGRPRKSFKIGLYIASAPGMALLWRPRCGFSSGRIPDLWERRHLFTPIAEPLP